MTRTDLHHFVDDLSEPEVDRIAMLVRAVRENNRPMITALTAPLVDDEEMAWIEVALCDDDAHDDLAQRTYSSEEVRHELGPA